MTSPSLSEAEVSSSTGARARSHTEFLRRWETLATLSEKQMDLCALVEEEVSSPWMMRTTGSGRLPLEEANSDEADRNERGQGESTESVSQRESLDTEDDLTLLRHVKTSEDFRKWHERMEKRLVEANEEKYRGMIQGLRDDKALVEKLVCSVASTQDDLQTILNLRQSVMDTTSRFRADCESLVSERKRMGELADALRKRLKYFEELETLTVKFGGGSQTISPTHPDFVRLLHRLDECIAYASNSTGAVAEADGYLTRFLDLQKRAFCLIRDYVVQQIRLTTAQVARELKDEGVANRMVRDLELTDASKEYLRYRTVAPKIKSLVSELHSRAKTGPSTFAETRKGSGTGGTSTSPAQMTRTAALSLLGDCEECYVDQRRKLLEGSIVAHVKSLGEIQNAVGLARSGSSFILQLCGMEKSLYEHFFPFDSDEEVSSLNVLLKGLCNLFYEEMRPRILLENDLEKLVYLIEVLRQEFHGDDASRKDLPGEAFTSAIGRSIADAQERIIFRAEVFIRDEIRGFSPAPANLNYPEIILDPEASKAAALAAATSTPDARRKREEELSSTKPSTFAVSGIYATWYPTVERTLRLLSMLYRCVDRQVFSGIAQEAVSICVQSVMSARARIASSGKRDAEEHGHLFLVWQVLMLREQISPFDVEFAFTEKELDFSELRSLLGRVLRGQVGVRALAAPPGNREKTVDAKRMLEQTVRSSCESFILKTTRVFLDPILAFLAKCNVVPTEPVSEGGGSEDAFAVLRKSPGSFAHPSALKEMWEKVSHAVRNDLAAVVEHLRIYVTKQSSRAVLLRPVRANFAEAASELISALQTRYTLEEREEIGIDGDSVEHLLHEIDVIFGSMDQGG